MTLTEEEAKKRWCPEARVYASTGAAYNRPKGASDVTTGALCLGSQCMAWRWADWHDDYSRTEADYEIGYCGKAGVPEAVAFGRASQIREHEDPMKVRIVDDEGQPTALRVDAEIWQREI